MFKFLTYDKSKAGFERDFKNRSDLVSYIRSLHDGGLKASCLARDFWILCSCDLVSNGPSVLYSGQYRLESYSHGRHLRAVLISEKIY